LEERSMTEAEWLECQEPERMLTFLEGKVSSRRGRLTVAASCRLVWPFLRDPRCRRSVEASEQFAEGLLSDRGRQGAYLAAERARWRIYRSVSNQVWPGGRVPRVLAASIASQLASCPSLDHQALCTAIEHVVSIHEGHRTAVADLLREICTSVAFPCTVEPSWLSREVRHLAEALCLQWDCSGLAVLSDALEDAGCTDTVILGHLRSPGPHALGCWPLDLILGKQ
jgi:hypothetical protein